MSPSVSKKQQRFMGMVRAAQKGEKAASPEVAEVAREMNPESVMEFAETKHGGLPDKKKTRRMGHKKGLRKERGRGGAELEKSG